MTKQITRLIMCGVVILSYGALLRPQSKTEIISKINQAEWEREEKLAGYTVTEHYQVYEQSDDLAIGDSVYEVKYVRGHGKTYKLVTRSVRKPFVNSAIDRIVHAQENLSQPDARKKVMPTSDNYYMILIDEGKEPQPKYICDWKRTPRKTRVVSLKPIHSSPGTIDGYLWVDATNFHVVRLEGRFSQSPSMWIGKPMFERDYVDRDGFAVAVSSCQIAERFTHDKSQITYENYAFLP